jgi:tRNA A-37 threonylcarbamoyl transferase component Bud32
VSEDAPRPAPPVERPGWEPGRVVAGRYAIARRLGGGSMGDVFLAEDRLLNKEVALKVLRPVLAQNRDTVRRFFREVALAHSVTHRNVVRIYDTGEEDGLPYFTMERLSGEVLDTLLEGPDGEPRPPTERLSIRKIRTIAIDVLDAIDAAHRAGVVHRDLKPGNVMLTHRGAIVMDFGVAGIDETIEHDRPDPAHESLRSLVRTAMGTIFGSPAYMAPELWEGEPASVQSDLYAFGVMLYQMLTGRLPYAAKTPAAYVERLTGGPPPPLRSLRRDTPWGLVRLARRCMARDPSDRPTSAAAAADMISPLRSRQRRRSAIAAALVAAAAGAAFVAQSRPPYARLGLPDELAESDLAASVRDLDAGEHGAALRRLGRLAQRAPRSSALRFWRATALHEIGDEVGRLEVCTEQRMRGSAAWVRLAEAACEPVYRLGDDVLDTLEGEGLAPELLPLAIDDSLLPRLTAAPDDAEATKLAERTLARLGEDEPDLASRWAMPVRWSITRARLMTALGQDAAAGDALAQQLADPHAAAPRLTSEAARLALLLGDRARAEQLAEVAAAADPTMRVRLALQNGRLDDAWARISAEPSVGRRTGLTQLWCGYALRMQMPTRPPRCADLPPGLVRALWEFAEQGTYDDTGLGPEPRAVLDRMRGVATGDCGPRGGAKAITIRWLSPPFELLPAELEVEAALCRGKTSEDLEPARRHARALVALAPEDPWVRLLAARVEEAKEPELAAAHRLAAAERWHDADATLPLPAWLRDRVVGRVAGPPPRTARRPDLDASDPPGEQGR